MIVIARLPRVERPRKHLLRGCMNGKRWGERRSTIVEIDLLGKAFPLEELVPEPPEQ